MTDTWKHAGDEAAKIRERVEQMKAPAVPDNVVVLFPPEPDLRSIEFQDKCGQFAEGLYRLSSRAEKDIGIHAVRGVFKAVLDEIDEQIKRHGGDGAA